MSQNYREDAIRHLARKSDGQPTPFISVHKNLVRVLHYAFHRKESSIAVIDLSSIENKEHVASLKILPPNDRYQGRGEYLVYGKIEKSSLILVISSKEFLDRVSSIPNDLFGMHYLKTSSSTGKGRQNMRKTLPPLDFIVGHYVGKLLQILEIPSKYLESATGIIVNDWRFPGHKWWEQNSEFLKGVKEGCADLQTPAIMKLTN